MIAMNLSELIVLVVERLGGPAVDTKTTEVVNMIQER